MTEYYDDLQPGDRYNHDGIKGYFVGRDYRHLIIAASHDLPVNTCRDKN